jgi:zinc/manganese transport system substrate-binding protein
LANVQAWVSNIEKTLAAADPADAADFRANAA